MSKVAKVYKAVKKVAKKSAFKGGAAVAGAALADSGFDDIKSGIKNVSPKKVIKGAAKVAGGALAIKYLNHPEWYTKGADTLLMGMPNIEQQDGRPYNFNRLDWDPDIYAAIPNHMSFVGRLMIPATIELIQNSTETNANIRVSPGWKQGIEQLYTAISRVNTSNRQYTPGTTESYVINARSSVYLIASIARALLWCYKYERDDLSAPGVYAKMLGYNLVDLQERRADYVSRLMSAIDRYHLNVPLKMSLLDRTFWLGFNVFRDDRRVSKDDDFVFMVMNIDAIVNDPATENVPSLKTYNVAGNPAFNGVSGKDSNENWAELPKLSDAFNVLEKILDTFAYTKDFSDIASDIWKAYGNEAAFDFNPVKKVLADIYTGRANPSTVYDSDIIDQFANATFVDPTNGSLAYSQAKIEGEIGSFAGGKIPFWKGSYTTLAMVRDTDASITQPSLNFQTQPYWETVNQVNRYGLVTMPDRDVGAGKVLSMTRLHSKAHYTGGPSTVIRTQLMVCNTEIIAYGVIHTAASSTSSLVFNLEPANNLISVPIAACNIYTYIESDIGVSCSQVAYALVQQASSEFDFMPRLINQPNLAGDSSSTGCPMGVSGRFDMWAPFPNTLCDSYSTIANFSLLWVQPQIRPLGHLEAIN